MSADLDCPFCAIIDGSNRTAKILYQDDNIIVFVPVEPATEGHILVVPKRHVSDIWGLEIAEAEYIAAVAVRMAHALRLALQPEGLNVIQSNGAAATQTVPHVHVHLVPRWSDDRMKLDWPPTAAQPAHEIDQTLEKIRKNLPFDMAVTSPEDRRQHLAFIQSVVTRMSQASASAKTWLLPIVTAAYGYALTKDSWTVATLGIGAVIVFGLLDANYLKQERSFRVLYDKVANGGSVPRFSMNPTLAASEGRRSNYWPDMKDVKSWAVAPVYGPFIFAGMCILLYTIFKVA